MHLWHFFFPLVPISSRVYITSVYSIIIGRKPLFRGQHMGEE